MNGPTYKTVTNFDKKLVRMDDPLFRSPWYLKGVRNGKYSWTRNSLFAKEFSTKIAERHVKALEAGADAEWDFFRKTWM